MKGTEIDRYRVGRIEAERRRDDRKGDGRQTEKQKRKQVEGWMVHK